MLHGPEHGAVPVSASPEASWSDVLGLGLYWLALGAAIDALPGSRCVREVLVVGGLAGSVLFWVPRRAWTPSGRFLGWTALALPFLALKIPDLVAAAAIGSALVWLRARSGERPVVVAACWGGAALLALSSIVTHVTEASIVPSRIAQAASWLLSRLSGTAISWSPSVLGLWVVITALAGGFASAWLAGNPRWLRVIVVAIGVPAVWLGHYCGVLHLLRHPLSPLGQYRLTTPEAALPALVALLALVGGMTWWRSAAPACRPPRRWPVVLLAWVILAPAAGFAVLQREPVGPKGQSVGILAKGADFTVPMHRLYGRGYGGLFGLAPAYLRAMGYRVRWISTFNDVEATGLDGLMLLLPRDELAKDEISAILRFLRRGGHMLVVGEHTDSRGVMKRLNPLLMHTGMALRFDSASGRDHGWTDSLCFARHPANRHADDQGGCQIYVGASVETAEGARPVIVGTWGWCDAGDEEAEARAYLGDRAWQVTEPTGDVTLAAAASYGKGEVLVVGDSSFAQNANMMTSYRFLAGIADWLASGPAVRPWPDSRLWLVPLLLGGLALLIVAGGNRWGVVGAFVILSATSFVPQRQDKRTPAFQPKEPWQAAYIDAQHGNILAESTEAYDAIWGLVYSLSRNRYLPVTLRGNWHPELQPGGLYIVIAPTRPFTAEEIRRLNDWVRLGGRMLVAVGWEEGEASVGLLNHFGLHVEDVPLAFARGSWRGQEIQFWEAWPVTCQSDEATIHVRAHDQPVVVEVPWGQGSVICIGDSGFLLNKNLEGPDGVVPGNVALLREIWEGWGEAAGQ